MKVTRLTIKNIGKIASESIELNKPLILFYGEIMSGKTTLLNAVKWVFGGAFPTDIIRHGQEEASVTLDFVGGSITREWYVAKDATTKAREIVFVRDGKPVKKPVQEIAKFLNPFLLNQDFLRDMTELERRKFFIDFLGVDTKELDTENSDLAEQARNLRSKIDGYGEIDLTPVVVEDASKLKEELAAARKVHADKHGKLNDQLEALREQERGHQETRRSLQTAENNQAALLKEHTEKQQEVVALRDKLQQSELDMAHLEDRLTESTALITDLTKTATKLPDLKPQAEKIKAELADPLDTSELESKIAKSAADEVRAEQYKANLARAEQKKKDGKLLLECESRQRDIKSDKAAKLAEIAASSGIAGLAFDADGNFIYQDTTAGMLSTSQIMRLSSDISAKYPEGFSMELIDRAESLGRSVFEYVEHAKKHNSTIMAAIVGDKPAKTPDECGVFVVQDGKIIP
jgi:DNA repair ATPase RecN